MLQLNVTEKALRWRKRKNSLSKMTFSALILNSFKIKNLVFQLKKPETSSG